jgi:transcriptional regulator with XRE-family HTH domain
MGLQPWGNDMLSKTLSDGLKNYRIGEKLHELRLSKKLGLTELGRHTGLSPALLSKIERGRLFPTLPTLLRTAMVFNVGLDFFFSEERRRPLIAFVRAGERLQFPDVPDGKPAGYVFECLDFAATERKFNSYFAKFYPAKPGQVRQHQHMGVEFIYIIRGKLGLLMGEEEHVLAADDSVYFDASAPHGYRRIGSRECCGFVVTRG